MSDRPIIGLGLLNMTILESVVGLHAEFLYKLTSCGLPSNLTSWLSAFLTNRFAEERVLTKSSTVISGVAQVSARIHFFINQ